MARSPSSPAAARDALPPGRYRETLESRLPVLRAALEQQRRFRREQIAALSAAATVGPAGSPDAKDREAVLARREVDTLVAAGARRALGDIELALVRMGTGRYGLCRACGARIPLVMLEAIPKTTLCLACHHRRERGGDRRMPPKSRLGVARLRRRRPTGSVTPRDGDRSRRT